MANTLLTPTAVTREALRILHQKLNFVGNVNRQYDSSFAQSGAKIGDSLKIRLPNQYTVRTGANLSAQTTNETSTTLQVATQKGVDTTFGTAELSLSMDDFASRILEPAMSVLAANIEADALSMVKDVYQQVGTPGTVPQSLRVWLDAKAKLANALAPMSDRYALMTPETNAYMVDALKGLFQDSSQIAKQYREGMMGRTSMADWYANEKVWTMTNVADVAGEINNGTLSSGITTLTVDGFTTIGDVGTVFTVENIYDVHPETKQSTGKLKQFVVTSGTTTTSLKFLPAMIYDTTNPKQNCSGTPVDGADITFFGSASTSYVQNIMFQKDAFTFVSAALPVYGSAEECRNTNSDGDDSRINLRVWKQPDIVNDRLILRIDALYGYKTIRPAWACRISA